ncbi:MAG: hypothetical protein PHP34_10930, partial [Bacteroidales bacterium]|nr:hypothetical protein [Bacteroidales bacterium]
MKTRISILFFLILFSYLVHAQEIIPFPNHYEQKEGKLNVPKIVTISTYGEFSSLIPEFVKTAKRFSIQAKEKVGKGFI